MDLGLGIMPDDTYLRLANRQIWFGSDPMHKGSLALFYAGERLSVNWISDMDQFGVPEFAQSARSFLANGLYGDCEDWGIFETSIMLDKMIPAVLVVGDVEGILHAWVEIYHEGRYWADMPMGRFFPREDRSAWRPITMYAWRSSRWVAVPYQADWWWSYSGILNYWATRTAANQVFERWWSHIQ